MENEDNLDILRKLCKQEEWYDKQQSLKELYPEEMVPLNTQSLGEILNAAIDKLNKVPSSSTQVATQVAEPDIKLEVELDRLRDEHETLRDTASHVFYTLQDVIPDIYLEHKELAAALTELEKLI